MAPSRTKQGFWTSLCSGWGTSTRVSKARRSRNCCSARATTRLPTSSGACGSGPSGRHSLSHSPTIIVYRTFADDTGIDYLLHHPDWDQAELLAQDDGHFMGPGLSWPELVAAADDALPGGSTTDPHARLLLLLPAFGDDEVPDDAVDRLAVALRARTNVEAPEPVASALLEDQGAPGPARWTTAGHGFSVNDGEYSFRNPDSHFALSADRLARVATALAP